MRNLKFDKPKTFAVIQSELGQTCSLPGCDNPLTHMQGPGSKLLCREHQLMQREYGGMGRTDRMHTFHRDWVCTECGYNSLEDPRLQHITDEMTRRRVARVLMHGDHHGERRADGGDDSAENVKCLCVVCHAVKTILNEDHLVKAV